MLLFSAFTLYKKNQKSKDITGTISYFTDEDKCIVEQQVVASHLQTLPSVFFGKTDSTARVSSKGPKFELYFVCHLLVIIICGQTADIGGKKCRN